MRLEQIEFDHQAHLDSARIQHLNVLIELDQKFRLKLFTEFEYHQEIKSLEDSHQILIDRTNKVFNFIKNTIHQKECDDDINWIKEGF